MLLGTVYLRTHDVLLGQSWDVCLASSRPSDATNLLVYPNQFRKLTKERKKLTHKVLCCDNKLLVQSCEFQYLPWKCGCWIVVTVRPLFYSCYIIIAGQDDDKR